MGVRGELFSARVRSTNDRRTYFFNVKENRRNDLFLTIVESKQQDGSEQFERHQIVVFRDDLELFRKGLETVIDFLERPANASRRPAQPQRERPERFGGGSPRRRDD